MAERAAEVGKHFWKGEIENILETKVKWKILKEQSAGSGRILRNFSGILSHVVDAISSKYYQPKLIIITLSLKCNHCSIIKATQTGHWRAEAGAISQGRQGLLVQQHLHRDSSFSSCLPPTPKTCYFWTAAAAARFSWSDFWHMGCCMYNSTLSVCCCALAAQLFSSVTEIWRTSCLLLIHDLQQKAAAKNDTVTNYNIVN